MSRRASHVFSPNAEAPSLALWRLVDKGRLSDLLSIERIGRLRRCSKVEMDWLASALERYKRSWSSNLYRPRPSRTRLGGQWRGPERLPARDRAKSREQPRRQCVNIDLSEFCDCRGLYQRARNEPSVIGGENRKSAATAEASLRSGVAQHIRRPLHVRCGSEARHLQ